MKYDRKFKIGSVSSMMLFFLANLATPPTTVQAKEATIAIQNKTQKSDAARSVESQINKQGADSAADKRMALLADGTEAIAQTKKALKLLDEKKTGEALKSLATVTGRLELILARDPQLALAPVETQVITRDLLADPESVKTMIKEAKTLLDRGDIQAARRLMNNLASEIDYNTVNIPLGTYPAAIKAIAPLIDAGKVDEAKFALQTALNTVVIRTDVMPLPKVRAEQLLKEAQILSEKTDRTTKETEMLAWQIKEARKQLKIGELLGYAPKKGFQPIYSQLDEIESKIKKEKSGTGWFAKVKQQISELL